MTHSDDQVEAAARVIWEFFTHEPWSEAPGSQHLVYRTAARTALTAAERVKDLPPAPPKIVHGRERYSDWILPAEEWRRD